MAANIVSVCWVVTGLIAFAAADFGDPPFIEPKNHSKSLKYGTYSADNVIQEMSLDEDEDPPVILAKVNTNDSLFVSYITPDNSATKLGISISDSNDVILNKLLDYEDQEGPSDHIYRFSIFSSQAPINSRYRQINLEVININDNPPIVRPVNTSCEIPEICVGDSCDVSCLIKLTDADGDLTPETVTVLDNDEVSSNFDVKFVNKPDEFTWIYKLNVIKALDYESQAIYSLTLLANDTLNINTTTLLVYVRNVRHRTPNWVTGPGVFQGEEKQEHTVKFTAMDGDTGLKDEIAYGLIFNTKDEEQYFSIDNETGLLTIGYIDRDILPSDYFSFEVLAYKKLYPEFNSSLTMTVIVLDIDDHTPNFTIGTDEKELLEIYIDERSTTLQLNDSIVVRDPDLGLNGTFSISLHDDPGCRSNVSWSENFLIVPASGYQDVNVTLAIKNGTELDYEDPNWRNIYMLIEAVESFNASHVNHTNVIIHLNDINDESPVFDKTEYNASLREDADVGDFVITCHATDADFNYTDKVTHILLPKSQKALTIDPDSGNITVATSNPYNYQQQQEVFLQVLAEDSNEPEPHRTYAQLTISIIDVNNEPPTITLPDTGSQPQVAENATTGTEVVRLTATDPDTGAELVFSIDWEKTYASKLGVTLKGENEKYYKNCFYIDTELNNNLKRDVTGIVRVTERHVFQTKNMDWGKFDTVFLTVKVTDLTTEPKFEQNMNRSTLLTVVIGDVNDNPPIFELDDYTSSVAENTDPDILITSVTATDADGPGNNNVTYEMLLVSTSLNETITKYEDFVKIDTISGKISTGTFNIDCEVYHYFVYNITATDGVFDTIVTMNISVIDKNDNSPIISSSLPDVHIKELSPNGTKVVDVSSHDIDYSVPFHTCYYLIEYTADPNGNVRNFFSIDIDTGHLIVNLDGGEPLNLVKTKTLKYYIPLMVRDNFADRQTDPTVSNAVRSMITVYIDDVNNNAPTFQELAPGEFLFTCTTHDAVGTVVMEKLQAPDLDEPGPNSWVKYKILNIEVLKGKQTTAAQDLFVITNNDDNTTATIIVGKNLTDWWGTYNITFFAQDEGDPPLNDTKSYSIHIQGFNDHDPVFTNPSPSMKYLILKKERQTTGSSVIKNDGNYFPDITATDEDEGENGHVTFEILGDEVALKYLKLSDERDDNSASLLIARPFDDDTSSIFTLQLKASDHGTNPRQRSTETSLNVLVSSQQIREPEFLKGLMNATFTENITGMSEIVPVTRPFDPDYNVSVLLNISEPIYYYLLDSTWDGMDHFQIDHESGNITLKVMLDREKIDNYTLHVLASKSATKPITILSQKSVLEVDIKVLDVYDTPPVFQQTLYTGGIKNGDSKGKVIFTVTATDEDLNDTTAFTIENSVASSDQLRKLMGDSPFSMNKYSGDLTLNADMDISNLQGYFKFDIRATDLGNNSNVVPGKVYIVSDSNLITFQFNNPLTDVKDKKSDIINIFTNIFGWQCSIDDMSAAKAIAEDNTYTNVRTHFVETEKDSPVDSSQIKLQLNVRSVISTLHNEFLKHSLEFNSFEDSTKSAASGNMEQVLQIVLIVISVILGTMVVVLFVAFFYRTRYLTQRLEALSETKFGSKDSGLNRIGMALPGTNQHAVDGSNPVWRNEDITVKDLDTASIGSGDSELIGIEDDPQFNPHIAGVHDRRPSFHPEGNERRNSFNPLYSQESLEKQKENDSSIPNHTGMQFTADKNIPTTEL